jgi:hypothetical protein
MDFGTLPKLAHLLLKKDGADNTWRYLMRERVLEIFEQRNGHRVKVADVDLMTLTLKQLELTLHTYEKLGRSWKLKEGKA